MCEHFSSVLERRYFQVPRKEVAMDNDELRVRTILGKELDSMMVGIVLWRS